MFSLERLKWPAPLISIPSYPSCVGSLTTCTGNAPIGSRCSGRARGDANLDSDFDVAVFLRGMTDRWLELHPLADLRVKLIKDTGAFFDLLPFPAGADAERSPFMRELRLEGVEL